MTMKNLNKLSKQELIDEVKRLRKFNEEKKSIPGIEDKFRETIFSGFDVVLQDILD